MPIAVAIFEERGLGKGGEATFAIDAKVVGKARIEHTVAGRFGIDTFGVGSDTGSPVTDTYKPLFPFTGKIERVDIAPQPAAYQPLQFLLLVLAEFHLVFLHAR